MPELEIRDVQSAATYRVAEHGSVLGREGAKADIVVRNPSVSKRHAKIYADNGSWFLEDLGSSNGTFFANQRISSPVRLSPGSLFALAEIQFEVVRSIGGGAAAVSDSADDDLEPPPPKRGGGRVRAATEMNADEAAEVEPESRDSAPASDDFDVGGGKDGVGAALAALPKAIAYYLLNVPKLALNPMGTIRRAVEDQPLPAMGKWEMIGWALPANLFSAAVGFLVTLILQLVSGTLSIGSIIPIVPLASAVIGSVVMGFIWHPLLKWFVKLLKGESDERSRSNYFVQTNAAVVLTVIPSGVAGLFALIPVPFIGIAPLILGVLAQLIMLALAHAWYTHFNVVKWFRTVLLVFMALAVLGTALNILNVIRAGAAGIGSGGAGASAELTDEQKKAIEEAQKLAEQAGAAGELTDEQKKALEEAQKLAEQAKAAGAAAGAEAEKAVEEAKKAAEEAGKAAEDAKKAAAEDTKKAEAEAKKAAEEAKKAEAEAKKAAAEEAKAAEKLPEPPIERPIDRRAEEAAPPVISGSGYPAFARKRDAIEKAVADDPTVLERSGVLQIYERYQRQRFDAIKAFKPPKSKNEPWRERINERLREAQVYRATSKTVDELYAKIFR